MNDASRGLRGLKVTVRLASAWLLAQGALYLLMGSRMADWLQLRYQPGFLSYIRHSGLALLVLGLLVRRTVDEPRRQVMAVDLLLLLFLGRVFFGLSFRVGVDVLLPLEWVFLVLDAGLAGALLLQRTRSSQMEGNDPLFSKPVTALGRELGSQLQKPRNNPSAPDPAVPATTRELPMAPPKPAVAQAGLPAILPPPSPSPAPSPAAGLEDPKHKPKSEALPRMD